MFYHVRPCILSSYGLEKKFKQKLYDDFERLTLETFKKGNLYGLEKYWWVVLSRRWFVKYTSYLFQLFHWASKLCYYRAFHFYRKEKDVRPLKKHAELEKLLDEQFRSLEDFQRAREKEACGKKDSLSNVVCGDHQMEQRKNEESLSSFTNVGSCSVPVQWANKLGMGLKRKERRKAKVFRFHIWCILKLILFK